MARTSLKISSRRGPDRDYADDDRRAAVAAYLSTGTFTGVEKVTGIDKRTVRGWRQHEWWDVLSAEIAEGLDDECKAKLRKVMSAGLDITLKKLPQANARDAATISAVAIDKLRLLDGKPTRISDQTNTRALAEQLAALSAQVNARTVSEQ